MLEVYYEINWTIIKIKSSIPVLSFDEHIKYQEEVKTKKVETFDYVKDQYGILKKDKKGWFVVEKKIEEVQIWWYDYTWIPEWWKILTSKSWKKKFDIQEKKTFIPEKSGK